MNRKLILEDGKTFVGQGFGASVKRTGTVIFHTGMTGYQEIFTDPTYYGKIVTMTSPTIGVYGFNHDDLEAFTPFVTGVIAKEVVTEPSNFRSEISVDAYLEKYDIPGIAGIDTRMLTTYLRQNGPMKGYIVDEHIQTVDEAKQHVPTEETLLVKKTSKTRPYIIPGKGKRVVVLDLGLKQSLLKELMEREFHLTVVPYDYRVEQILQYKPDGVFVSSGPGNPNSVTETIETVKALLNKVPLFAVGLGHQIFALACGAKTKQLNVSEYGNHYPVQDIVKNRAWFATKSSSFTVDETSLKNLDLVISFRGLNDGTVEGIAHTTHPAFSVQFQPEGAPGSNETSFVFDQFLALIEQNIQKNGGR